MIASLQASMDGGFASLALYAYAFYLAFALSISVYRQWVKGTLNVLNKVLFMPVLLTFFALDVILNYSLFMVMGAPPKGCRTISDRLAFYRQYYNGWKNTIAVVICEKLLNPIDPNGSHC